MLAIVLKDRQNLSTLYYLTLSQDQQHAHSTKDCEKASHFRSALAAAQVRDRFQPAFDAMLVVEECHCLTGLDLHHKLFPETPYK